MRVSAGLPPYVQYSTVKVCICVSMTHSEYSHHRNKTNRTCLLLYIPSISSLYFCSLYSCSCSPHILIEHTPTPPLVFSPCFLPRASYMLWWGAAHRRLLVLSAEKYISALFSWHLLRCPNCCSTSTYSNTAWLIPRWEDGLFFEIYIIFPDGWVRRSCFQRWFEWGTAMNSLWLVA
jgi:hypothetical protein